MTVCFATECLSKNMNRRLLKLHHNKNSIGSRTVLPLIRTKNLYHGPTNLLWFNQHQSLSSIRAFSSKTSNLPGKANVKAFQLRNYSKSTYRTTVAASASSNICNSTTTNYNDSNEWLSLSPLLATILAIGSAWTYNYQHDIKCTTKCSAACNDSSYPSSSPTPTNIGGFLDNEKCQDEVSSVDENIDLPIYTR